MCAKVYQNITCEWSCVSIITYFIEKQPTSAQKPDNEVIASNKKFPGL